MEGTTIRARPGPVGRALLRAPVYLYQAGLGRLLGRRFILIRHQGRATGRLYETVVEVVRYDPVRGEYFVVSGFGPGANWYRNLRAAPALEVEVAGRSFRPEQRLVGEEEAEEVLGLYARAHPLAVRVLSRWLTGPGPRDTAAARRELARRMPMVAFREP